jgi:lysophospholipid acyltransferase (LPLAT)-like uncharacterized protein
MGYYCLSVPAHIDKAFTHASLDAYSLKQRILVRLTAFGLYFLFHAIGKTLRYEIEGWENLERVEREGKQPIYCFWHDRIFAGTYFFRNRKIIVMNSLSFDGAYMARFVQKLGYGSVRGSSTRGGTGALVEMIRLMRSGFATAFTVDGPRGPRYEAKLGPVLLSKKTGDPMLPFLLECKRFWTVGSWDRAQIPKPFSQVKLMIEKPIQVSENASDDELEVKRLELQSALEALVARGAEWRGNV